VPHRRSVPRGTLRLLSFSAGAGAAILVWAEVVHAHASRQGFPSVGTRSARISGDGVIVVLGIANRGGRANVINRWRARMALRSVPDPPATTTTIVTSGGAVRGPVAEATLLAQYLREDLGWRGTITEETSSRSTWENIRNVIPGLEDTQWIMLVSNSLHAEKARIALRRLRPDLAARLVPANDYSVGEMMWFKPALAVIGLVKLRALR